MRTNVFVGRRCCDSLMCMQMYMSDFSCPKTADRIDFASLER